MTFMEYLDDLAERISLRKRFPGYFNPWIFRGAIFLMVVLLGVVAYTDKLGAEPFIYVECPATTHALCMNPFFGYDCYSRVPEKYAALCTKETFFPGETFGTPPSWLYENYTVIGIGVIVLAFGINHLFYRWRSGKWYYSR